MSFTQADVNNLEDAYKTALLRGAATVKINGREVTYTDIDKLKKALDMMQGIVNRDTYGASMPVIFKEVTD